MDHNQEPNFDQELKQQMDLIRVPKVDNVKLIDRLNYDNPDVGTLYLTPTHVIFVDPDSKKEYWILLMLVCSIEKLPSSITGTPLFIKCKNFLHVTFLIPKEKDAIDVYMSLNQLSQPTKISELYCFFYNCRDEPYEKSDGWKKFNLRDHYKRFIQNTTEWVASDINKDYSICPTYPSVFHVPKLASNECLYESAKFRSKGRLPVLSYLYTNGASICRCSQPLSGFSNRSLEDELLFEHIRRANPNSKVHIVDTRPKINAMANRAAGKGYENEQFYSNAKFHFFSIENIHVMRASLNKLLDACDVKLSVNYFLSNIESSHWLKHVKSLLETSDFIAQSVKNGISVVVHCSDGWDRTAQACSLSALALDPYYRTIDGFQALIHKEWLSFGYKFSDRCGHILSDTRETAPVFTQFLDAVWQIQNQYPTEFEFNEDMLIVIHDHIYSCQFGTFVGNCEKERLELDVSKKTYSLWAHLDNHRDEYLNPFYNPMCGKVDLNNSGNKKQTDAINIDGQQSFPEESINQLTEQLNLNSEAAKFEPTAPTIEAQDQTPSQSPPKVSATLGASNCSITDHLSSTLTGSVNSSFLKVDTSPQLIKFWRGLYNRHELLIHPRESFGSLLIVEKNEIKVLESQIKFLDSKINSRSLQASS